MTTAVHPPDHGGRRPVSAEVVGAVGIGGLAVAALLSPAHIADGPVVCPFRLLTGLPCPGCGLTRSWVYLLHGDVHQALWANPFGPVLILAVVALAAAAITARVRRRPPPSLDQLARRRWVQAIFTAWVAFGVIRIVVILLQR